MSKYNDDQLCQYFNHVSLPEDSLTRRPTLEFLNDLLKHQLTTVPFENLTLHYSQYHLLSLNPDDLFEKVVNRHRGGYCMENNTFFGTILRSLGFNVMSGGARESRGAVGKAGARYGGWSHMINLVKIGNIRYLADVGFGADGPSRPIPLKCGHECTGIVPQMLRIDYKALFQHVDCDQRVWVYSYRRNEEHQWTEAYSFTEIEFFPEDFTVMNLSTMTSRKSVFTQAVICLKALMDIDSKELEGMLILYKDEIKKRVHGQTTVLEKFSTEEARVAALERWFGIWLSKEEKMGIRDLSTELRIS